MGESEREHRAHRGKPNSVKMGNCTQRNEFPLCVSMFVCAVSSDVCATGNACSMNVGTRLIAFVMQDMNPLSFQGLLILYF